MNKAFDKLNTEQKDLNIYMQTLTFICHKMPIGKVEEVLSVDEERTLAKVAMKLQRQYDQARVPFDIEQFKSLFRRSAKSLKDSRVFKKGKLTGGKPKEGEEEQQVDIYEKMPVDVSPRRKPEYFRWFKNAMSLRWNVEKLDILALLALFLGIFQLWCAWQTLSSLSVTLTGSSTEEITEGFSSFIAKEISVSGFESLFTFAFIGNAFNRVFANELDFLQTSLISQIGNVSGTLSSSIQSTCFTHALEKSAWSTMLSNMISTGNFEIQLQCINEVTQIEGNRALANIGAEFQLKNTKFKTSSQIVLNLVWSGIFFIRGSVAWYASRLGYYSIATSFFDIDTSDMEIMKPSVKIHSSKNLKIEAGPPVRRRSRSKTPSPSPRPRIKASAPVAASAFAPAPADRASSGAKKLYLGQPPANYSSPNREEDIGF